MLLVEVGQAVATELPGVTVPAGQHERLQALRRRLVVLEQHGTVGLERGFSFVGHVVSPSIFPAYFGWFCLGASESRNLAMAASTSEDFAWPPRVQVLS